MNYKTHMNGSALVALYVSSQMQETSIILSAAFFGSAILGSLFPDIDHGNSYIGQKVKPVSKTINKFAGHRKLFHAPLVYLLLYSVAIGMVKNKLQIFCVNGLFIGILSHLILDSLTVGGLCWLYPFTKKRFSLAKIKTNGQLEYTLCSILTCLNIAIIFDLLHITSIFTFTQK